MGNEQQNYEDLRGGRAYSQADHEQLQHEELRSQGPTNFDENEEYKEEVRGGGGFPANKSFKSGGMMQEETMTERN